jgi:DNA-binding beta-propeller fold protein YncE
VPKAPAAVATTPAPERAAIAPDGSSLYVTSAFERGVVRHAVGADGALGPRSAAVPAGDQPIGITLGPDGRSAYVADPVGFVGVPGRIWRYTVGAGGALVPASPAFITAGSHPFDVVVSPDGRNLYATDSDAPGGVLQFAVGAGATLTPLSPAEVPAGAFPLGLAVSADGRNVYAADAGADSVSQYARGADGRLTPLSPATVPAGENPIEVALTPGRREPATKDDCKDGGWRAFGFRNQGRCVAAVNHGRPVTPAPW